MQEQVKEIAQGYIVEYVLAQDLPDVWPFVYESLARACDRTMAPIDIYRAVEAKQAVLWLVLTSDRCIAASLVTRMQEKGSDRWMEVLAMGGENFKGWAQAMQKVLEDTLHNNGGSVMRAYCKRGVARMLKPLGWKERQVIMEWNHGR